MPPPTDWYELEVVLIHTPQSASRPHAVLLDHNADGLITERAYTFRGVDAKERALLAFATERLDCLKLIANPTVRSTVNLTRNGATFMSERIGA